MKVWINHREGGYTGGLILVAANSAEEAIKAFHDDPDFWWAWDEWDGYIEEEYYPEYGWKELPNVVANVDKPQVLAEGGYTE